MFTNATFKIKMYSLQKLAYIYGVSYDAFINQINPIKPKLMLRKDVKLLTTLQVKTIVEFLGPPEIIFTLQNPDLNKKI